MSEADAKKMFNKITWEEFRKIFDPVFTKEKGWRTHETDSWYYKWMIPESTTGAYLYVQLIMMTQFDNAPLIAESLIIDTNNNASDRTARNTGISVKSSDPRFTTLVNNPEEMKKAVMKVLHSHHEEKRN